MILIEHPDKEDFLLPDINMAEIPRWNENIRFSQYVFQLQIANPSLTLISEKLSISRDDGQTWVK